MALSRLTVYPLGSMSITTFVGIMLLVQWPEGDPGKAREVAAVWRRIAARVDTSLRDMDEVAEAVWKTNTGEGVDAFEAYWRDRLKPYPPQVSAYARGLAKVCDDYADVLDDTQRKVLQMAIISYLEMLMFMAWPEIGGMTTWFARRAMRKVQAKLLLRLAEYVSGSLFYAIADQIIVDGVKLAFGDDIGSLEDNLVAMGKNFAAAMVFYSIDPANFKRVGVDKILPKNADLQKYVVFLAGSSVFTVTANALNRPGDILDDPAGLLPTWQQMISKFLVGAGQLGKGWSRQGG
ncbi:WXG100-like domain-containing protein [Nonomuraea sp. NPDC004354]